MTNSFLVSVAEAILRDPNSGEAIAYGKANISSAFTVTMAATEVRGGINNPLLYVYYHDRAIEVKVEEAVFNKTTLALNAGQSVLNNTVAVTQTDCLVLSASGSATLTQTPTGNAQLFMPNGTVQNVVPAGSVITYLAGANQKVDAVYITNLLADQITIETTTPPSVVDMTLLAQVRDNTGVITEYLQIEVPRFQITGNYTLSFAANGVSNQTLDGKALAVASTNCASGEYYAKATWIPAAATSLAVASIAAVPGKLTWTGLTGAQNLSVLGIRGSLYTPMTVTTSCSFVSSLVAAFTAGLHTGVITPGSSMTGSSTATITVTYRDATNGLLYDYVTASGSTA
jgi:hypothetical protein